MKISNKVFKWFSPVLFIFVLCPILLAQDNINSIGSFEQDGPSYWNKGSEPGGSTLTWATDQYMTLGRSLKISKTATSEAAMWESDNMCDIWSPTHSKDVDIKIGAWIRTEGVNTSPANDDQMWYVSYSFTDSAGVLMGEVKLPIDQTVATSGGWVADTNGVGDLTLPRDSWTTIIRVVGGKDATGTVWADEFILSGRGAWAGGIWNETLVCPKGWIYWLPRTNGLIDHGYEDTRINTEDSYHGNYSLKFDMLNGTHDAFIGTKFFPLNGGSGKVGGSNDISALDRAVVGDVLRISVWIKGENLEPDSVLTVGDQWSVSLTPIFHTTLGGNEGFGDYWASDIPLKFPHATSFDWTQFYVDVEVPAPPSGQEAKSLDVRLHPLGRFQGTVWMDGLTVEVLDLPEISGIGSFEQDGPSYWNKGSEPGGSTLTWATDQYMTLGRSLKISKTATSEAAMWESDNMCDIWSPTHSKDVDIKIGAWIRTEGVNTSPANDDQMWYVSYSFTDSAGVLMGEVKLPIDQTVATSGGWVADTNGVGDLTLPRDSWTTIIRVVGGKDATGTVWADEFILSGRGAWAGGIWNETLVCPKGWIYWLPRTNGLIDHGYEDTRINTEDSYHGNYSLKFDMLNGTHDAFIGTKFFPLNGGSGKVGGSNDISALDRAVVGDVLRISVWIKGENLEPDSVLTVGDQWSVSLTPIFHTTLGGNEGFGDYWASDIPLKFPHATSFDWTQFYVDVEVPAPPSGQEAKSLDVRLHPLGRFQGTVWMDGLTVEVLDLPEISGIGSFEQDGPSYWNKGSEPGGSTLTWATDQYMTLGRSLKISKTATSEAAMWESDNMCDIWSPTHSKDVDIKIGAWIRTEGVNTSPANDDQMWYVSYSFTDSAGVLMGEVKLPIDQTVATSGGWVADTNGVGDLTLPRDSWTTIIRVVGGKDATGTVWADEFILSGRGAWAGGIWNETLVCPKGWIYWLPRTNGLIDHGYEDTRINTEDSYHGNYSLKFDMLNGTHDAFIGTKFFPLNGGSGKVGGSNDITALDRAVVGDVLRISVWIKGENLEPDSVLTVGDQWSVSLTPIFHTTLGGNEGFGDYWASDIPLKFPHATSFDWTQFYVDVEVPAPPSGQEAKSLDVRLHPLGRFQGTVWMDALEVKIISGVTDVKDHFLPVEYSLFQNYPNPFNPSTIISYALPEASHVSIKIFNMLGREVQTLFSGDQSSGIHSLTWNGENSSGVKVSSGAYLYRIEAGEFSATKKMIFLK